MPLWVISLFSHKSNNIGLLILGFLITCGTFGTIPRGYIAVGAQTRDLSGSLVRWEKSPRLLIDVCISLHENIALQYLGQ